MICTSCGKNNQEGQLFCGYCGSRIERRQGQRRQADRRQGGAPKASPPIEIKSPRVLSEMGISGGAVLPPRQPARAGLDQDFPARTERPVGEPRAGEPSFGGGGPSFLGLGETSNYLLEEDQPSGGRSYGRFITLLILLAAVAAVAANWERIKEAATAARDHSVVTAPAPTSGLPVASGQPAAAPGSDTQGAPAAKPADGAQAPQSGEASDDSGESAKPQGDESTADEPKSPTAKAGEADAGDPLSPSNRGEAGRAKVKPAKSGKEERASRAEPVEEKQVVKQADKFLYGGNRDCGRAVSILSRAAEQGNFEAQTKLGVLYSTGTCVPFNRVRAYDWYLRASRSTDSPWVERNKSILWGQMTEAEKQQVAGR